MITINLDGTEYRCRNFHIGTGTTVSASDILDGVLTVFSLEDVTAIDGKELPVRGGIAEMSVRTHGITITTKTENDR